MRKIAISIILICISLGTWQISRFNQKSEMINKINDDTFFDITKQMPKKIDEYYKIKLFGHFLHDKNIFLYKDNTHCEVFTLFKIEKQNQYVLVNRGIINNKNLDKINNQFLQSTENQEITGIIRYYHNKMIFVDNDIKNNMWIYVDIPMIENYLNKSILDFVVFSKKSYSDYIEDNVDILINNYHINYIFMWYSIAILIFISMLKRNK